MYLNKWMKKSKRNMNISAWTQSKSVNIFFFENDLHTITVEKYWESTRRLKKKFMAVLPSLTRLWNPFASYFTPNFIFVFGFSCSAAGASSTNFSVHTYFAVDVVFVIAAVINRLFSVFFYVYKDLNK